MGVATEWNVVISCDGDSRDRPEQATFETAVHLGASIRLAGRAGWEVSDLVLCPRCSNPGSMAPALLPLEIPRSRRAHLSAVTGIAS